MKKQQHRKIHRSKSSAILCPFEHRYACWANNHNGWSKKWYRRYDKHILKRQDEAEIQQQIQDHEDFLLDCAIEADELDNYMSFLQEQIEKWGGDYDSLTDEQWEFYISHYEWWHRIAERSYLVDD